MNEDVWAVRDDDLASELRGETGPTGATGSVGPPQTKEGLGLGKVANMSPEEIASPGNPVGDAILSAILSAGALVCIVQGTQDGNPKTDQWLVIQTAWDNARNRGQHLFLTPGPEIIGNLDVRINRALKQYSSGARIKTDGRVRLHGFFENFTSVTGGIGSGDAIDTGTMIFVGPDPALPATARVADCELENITCVFHPPVNGAGARVASLVTTNFIYIDRVDNPRAYNIEGSGLNAGNGFAFASCTNVDFDGITVHDCLMFLDTNTDDLVVKNKQITGVNADDMFAGRGISPTKGGFIRNINVYRLDSNRTFRQVDGVNDQGTNGVVWDGMIISGVDEGLDTWGTGSTYSNLDFYNNTNDLKIGHGAFNNTISGRSRNSKSSPDANRCVAVLFAGHRRNTSYNTVDWVVSGYEGTRFVEITADNSDALSVDNQPILTKVNDNYVNIIARGCRTLRMVTDGGTLPGNVVNIDIDEASINNTFAPTEQELFQASGNTGTRVSIKRTAVARPFALSASLARLQGASYATGYYNQATGALVSLSSWAELDLVHGNTGTGFLRRIGAGNYEFTTAAPTYTSGPISLSITSGQTRYWAAAFQNAGAGAGTEIGISLSPNANGPGVRDVQVVGIQTGGGVADCVFRTPNGDLPAESMRLMAGGQAWLPGLDNLTNIGSASKRMSQIFAGTGTISTSDARDKTPIVPLDEREIAAAKALAAEIGLYQFLSACADKGENARRHIGMAVQRAMEVMAAHDLDPLAYAFICHDEWPATPPVPEIREDVLDENGEPTGETYIVQKAEPARPAGDRYGFRTDELLLFIARGFDARLTALENRAA